MMRKSLALFLLFLFFSVYLPLVIYQLIRFKCLLNTVPIIMHTFGFPLESLHIIWIQVEFFTVLSLSWGLYMNFYNEPQRRCDSIFFLIFFAFMFTIQNLILHSLGVLFSYFLVINSFAQILEHCKINWIFVLSKRNCKHWTSRLAFFGRSNPKSRMIEINNKIH